MAVSDRIMRILGAFEDATSPLTLKDIADVAGVPMSTTHRLVWELVAMGALERDEDRRYVVGLRLFGIGVRATAAHQDRVALLPELVGLHTAGRQPVVYSVPDGAMFRVLEVLHLHSEDPGVRVGDVIPLDLNDRTTSAPVASVVGRRAMLTAGLFARSGRLRGAVSLLGRPTASMRSSAALLESSISRMSRVIRDETMPPERAIRRAG